MYNRKFWRIECGMETWFRKTVYEGSCVPLHHFLFSSLFLGRLLHHLVGTVVAQFLTKMHDAVSTKFNLRKVISPGQCSMTVHAWESTSPALAE